MPHALLNADMPTSGQRVDPYAGFRFKITCPGVMSWRAGFQSVEGIEDENDVIDYKEGTDRVIRKLPGSLKFTELVLARGKSRTNDLQIWRAQVDIFRKTGQYPAASFRRTLKIELMDDFLKRLKGWTYYQTWCSKLSHNSLDASTSGVLVESATIQNEGYDPDPLDIRAV
jgi:phage tail-like protein